VVGVGLAEVGAEAGGEGVAETDDEGRGSTAGAAGCAGAGCVETGTEAVVSAFLFAGLQALRRRLAAREVSATKAIVDKLGATRGWVTVLF